MNDLITAATSGLFVEIGKVIEHMKAQQTRIADLERQLAEASAPAVAQQIKLDDIEQYRQQMAGISTAALGYWKEGDSIHPDYDTIALRDVAKLYAKCDALYKAADTDKVREAMNKLHADIMNLSCTRTMSHFATTDDMKIYKQGHRDARHAAAELVASMAGGMG